MNLIIYTNIPKAIQLMNNNQHNQSLNIVVDNNDKTNIDFAKIYFAKFTIHIKISLANSIRKTYYR